MKGKRRRGSGHLELGDMLRPDARGCGAWRGPWSGNLVPQRWPAPLQLLSPLSCQSEVDRVKYSVWILNEVERANAKGILGSNKMLVGVRWSGRRRRISCPQVLGELSAACRHTSALLEQSLEQSRREDLCVGMYVHMFSCTEMN